MNITIDGRTQSFSSPVSTLAAARSLWGDEAELMLGFFLGGRVLDREEVLREDTQLRGIRFDNEEGRRIYERSLRFLFLLAAKRVFPHVQVRIEHSIGQGIYIHLQGMRLTMADVARLEEEMRHIVSQDLPYKRHTWTRERAVRYFTENGDLDKAKLMGYRTKDDLTMYECGGLYDYFYGVMLESTGKVPVFALRWRAPGVVLRLPDPRDPTQVAPYMPATKNMAAFAQSNYWCDVLGYSTAAELNDLVAQDRLRDFIRVNEAFHDKSLSEIAESIANSNARAIFIAGPSSSGKTTFANRLSIHLRVLGYRPVILSMDDFYIDRHLIPLEEDGKPDLEALSALDVGHFKECLASLLAGELTLLPRFSFKTGRREEKGVYMRVDHLQPLIIEGIHGLNPALHAGFDPQLLFKIYISQLTCINLDNHSRIRTTDARLLRRIVRDYQFRATPPGQTLAMWDSVRRGEEKWIFPYQEQVDVVFNSALHYELPVLKTISYDILSQVTPDDPNYIKCSRILKILDYFLPATEADIREIPPLSILREFIGGNTLYEGMTH